jgi:hypothetical protein
LVFPAQRARESLLSNLVYQIDNVFQAEQLGTVAEQLDQVWSVTVNETCERNYPFSSEDVSAAPICLRSADFFRFRAHRAEFGIRGFRRSHPTE